MQLVLMQKISYLFLIKVKNIKTGVCISTWFVHTGIDSKSIFTIREMFFSYKFVLSLSLVQDHWLFILVETPRCNQADKGWSICFTYNKLFTQNIICLLWRWYSTFAERLFSYVASFCLKYFSFYLWTCNI